MIKGLRLKRILLIGGAAALVAAQPALAQSVDEWQSQDVDRAGQPATEAVDAAVPAAGNDELPAMTSSPVVQSLPGEEGEFAPHAIEEPVMFWMANQAEALLDAIEFIGSEGLFPEDYMPGELRAAIDSGDQGRLDEVASKAFAWLAEDLRDGRTPMTARVQWFAVDPDQDLMPTRDLMAEALKMNDVAGVLARLTPTHPDYTVLKNALATAQLAASTGAQADKKPEKPGVTAVKVETAKPAMAENIALIRANLDRWRWLARDLGPVYLITNVPEFQLRLTVKDRIIRTYKTVVGKPGRTATPQLAETVSAVVFNPTWTVPQSIVKGEGLGMKVLSNPGWARANGYKATKGANGYISVVQQPGPGNALGLMKIDIPNEHAIYFHDTPSKQYFNHEVRAYSHGCIRTERAVELGMTMAILGARLSPEEAAEISRSREYTKVQMTRTFPAYITYFTMATDINGQLSRFDDIYGRDTPVLESFEKPREIKTTQRKSDEEIIQLDNPL